MKPIELKLKIYSKKWLSPVLLIFTAFFAMAMVNQVTAAKPVCENPDLSWPKCEDSGGGGEEDYIQTNKSILAVWGNAVNLRLPYETDPAGVQNMRLCGPYLDEQPEPIIPPHPMVAE